MNNGRVPVVNGNGGAAAGGIYLDGSNFAFLFLFLIFFFSRFIYLFLGNVLLKYLSADNWRRSLSDAG